jgi:hypothetical protein
MICRADPKPSAVSSRSGLKPRENDATAPGQGEEPQASGDEPGDGGCGPFNFRERPWVLKRQPIDTAVAPSLSIRGEKRVTRLAFALRGVAQTNAQMPEAMVALRVGINPACVATTRHLIGESVATAPDQGGHRARLSKDSMKSITCESCSVL